MYFEFITHKDIEDAIHDYMGEANFKLKEYMIPPKIVYSKDLKVIMFRLNDTARKRWGIPSRWLEFYAVGYGGRTFIFGEINGLEERPLETLWQYKGECNLKTICAIMSVIFRIGDCYEDF